MVEKKEPLGSPTPPSAMPERHGASVDERDLTKGERRRGGQDVKEDSTETGSRHPQA